MPQNRWYASLFYDLGGLDAGATVHYVRQHRDSDLRSVARKVREWTTLDTGGLNYDLWPCLHPRPPPNEVPGYAKDTVVTMRRQAAITDKNAIPVSTAGLQSMRAARLAQ